MCLFMFEKIGLTKILPVGIKISRANLKRKQNRENDRKKREMYIEIESKAIQTKLSHQKPPF